MVFREPRPEEKCAGRNFAGLRCSCLADAGRRHRPLGSESKDFITHNTDSSIGTLARIPCPYTTQGWRGAPDDTCTCGGLHLGTEAGAESSAAEQEASSPAPALLPTSSPRGRGREAADEGQLRNCTLSKGWREDGAWTGLHPRRAHVPFITPDFSAEPLTSQGR